MPDTFSAPLHLETDRLRLKSLERGDGAALQAMTDHPLITDAIHFLPVPFTVADAERLITGAGDGRDRFIGAWRTGDPGMVAVVGTHLRGDDEVEVGYWVRADCHGRGYATEAVAAAIATLRDRFPKRRIIAECRPENNASWHVLDKLGFRPTGEAGRRPGRRHLVLG